MPRVIGGGARGRRLESRGGRSTRPTGSRVRQTLFDVLAPRIAGCAFLDLFAGTGAVGLEALSRGSARVLLVERDAACVAVIRRNALALGAQGGRAEVWHTDGRAALRRIARARERFDVVFLDPPYDSPLYVPTLLAISELGLLEEQGLAVAERFHKRSLPETIGRLVRRRTVRVGDHRLDLYGSPESDRGGAFEST